MNESSSKPSNDVDNTEVPAPSAYGDPGENPETGLARPSRWPNWLRRRSRPQPVRNFDQARQQQDLEEQSSRINFRRVYAVLLLGAMLFQVGIADYFFWRYMQAYCFKVPEKAMSVWIGAAVVQLIGLVAVITHYFFPDPKDN